MYINLKLLVLISKNMEILYVEDNENTSIQTIKLLKNYFTNISVAKNGKEGLEKFKNNSYHIIFTDIEMPTMDGITMIEHIREIDKEIPIVIFSAYDKKEYFLKTIKAGIDGYILKPYNCKEVFEVIEKVVMKSEVYKNKNNKIVLNSGIIWDKKNLCLSKDRQSINLTCNEIKLLELLCSAKNTIIKNSDIERYVFGKESSNSKKIINLISRLQIKINQTIIESYYGNGYKLI